MASGPWHSMALAPHMRPGEFNHMPCVGPRRLVGYTAALEKIKLYFPAQSVQREQFGYMHTLLVCDGSYLH